MELSIRSLFTAAGMVLLSSLMVIPAASAAGKAVHPTVDLPNGQWLNFQKKDKPAIIFEDTVEVKAEPKEDADNAFTLHEGTKVFVKETLDNYKRIQLTDKTEGWVLSSAIKEVR